MTALTDAQVTGASAPLILSGKEYLATPLTDKDLAEFDLWLQQDVIRVAASSLPGNTSNLTPELKALRDEILAAAMKTSATISWATAEGNAILNTPRGIARIAFLMLRKHQPDVTPEKLQTLASQQENVLAITNVFQQLNSALWDSNGSTSKNDQSE